MSTSMLLFLMFASTVFVGVFALALHLGRRRRKDALRYSLRRLGLVDCRTRRSGQEDAP